MTITPADREAPSGEAVSPVAFGVAAHLFAVADDEGGGLGDGRQRDARSRQRDDIRISAAPVRVVTSVLRRTRRPLVGGRNVEPDGCPETLALLHWSRRVVHDLRVCLDHREAAPSESCAAAGPCSRHPAPGRPPCSRYR